MAKSLSAFAFSVFESSSSSVASRFYVTLRKPNTHLTSRLISCSSLGSSDGSWLYRPFKTNLTSFVPHTIQGSRRRVSTTTTTTTDTHMSVATSSGSTTSSSWTLDHVLDQLWHQYTRDTPQVQDIVDLFLARESRLYNDHIALRTLDDPRINIDHLAAFFIQRGYQPKGSYSFPVKKLDAIHLQHQTDPSKPKIFISQLRLSQCSTQARDILTAVIDAIPVKNLHAVDLLWAGTRLWIHQYPPSQKQYQLLLQESEYAAWFYVFGFRANHFTVDINKLESFPNGLQQVNDYLSQNGVKLNTQGGLIKGSPSDLLCQSSTLAANVLVDFVEGPMLIPNSYYEFAQRYPDQDGRLYQGFIAASADKIFESTDTQVKS